MSPVDFFAKQSNRLAILEFDVTNNDGSAVDLTSADVEYHIWPTTPGTDTLTAITAVVTLVAPITPATIWSVTVAWGQDDLDVAGRYYGRCDLTLQNGNQLTVPTVGYHSIFVDALGPIV